MEVTQRINSIQEIQDALKTQLEQNTYFAKTKIPVVCENSAQIDYIIKNSLGKLGVVCVVQTPKLEFYGKDDDGHPVWALPEVTLVISEIPTVNRARAGAFTALDAALLAAETINEMGSAVALSDINQMESQGVISVFVSFKTTAHFCYVRTEDTNDN